MDQSKMEEIMEFLRAIEHKREADKAESMANQLRMEAEMEANQEKMDPIEQKMTAKMDAMQATLDSQLEETMACLGETKASSETTESCEGKSHACPLKTEAEKESAPEDAGAVAESQEVPKGATGKEAIGVTDDRSRNLRLAVGCRRQLETRTKHDGGSRQECAAAVGRPTRRSVSVMHRRGLRRGPGKKCRRGLKGRGKTSGNGMRETIGKQRRLLERKKTHSEAITKSLGMETAKLMVESPIGLREPGDGLLWKCRPPPKRKR
jgi:hypothetical protein